MLNTLFTTWKYFYIIQAEQFFCLPYDAEFGDFQDSEERGQS